MCLGSVSSGGELGTLTKTQLSISRLVYKQRYTRVYCAILPVVAAPLPCTLPESYNVKALECFPVIKLVCVHLLELRNTKCTVGAWPSGGNRGSTQAAVIPGHQ